MIRDYVTKSEQKALFDLLLELHNFLYQEGMKKQTNFTKKINQSISNG